MRRLIMAYLLRVVFDRFGEAAREGREGPDGTRGSGAGEEA